MPFGDLHRYCEENLTNEQNSLPGLKNAVLKSNHVTYRYKNRIVEAD